MRGVRAGLEKWRRRDSKTQLGLWGMEADLDACSKHVLVVLGCKGCISGGFEQAKREVLGGAEAFLEQAGQQIAFFNDLSEDTGDLQQEVIDLYAGLVVGICVFELVAAVFLYIETFVFNSPSLASSLVA